MAINGYVEFQNNGPQLEMILHAPSDGGRSVTVDDVVHCLEKQKIDFKDLVSLVKFLKAGVDKSVLKLGPAITPFNDWCEYDIASNLMSVEARHYAGCVGMSKPTLDEIKRDLQQRLVIFGLIDSELDKLVSANHYMENLVIAEGIAPIEGKDAVLNYCFDVNKEVKPSINEDGTVDYRNLDSLNHVKEGDVVATITPLNPGVPGKNVRGNDLMPAKVKNVNFKFGRNMVVSDDGLSLVATTNGHVSLEGDKIFVSNVLEVVDVDNSTGNISYEGDIVVTGNVLAGFTVKASGNIEIRGIVEGAYVEAGGNITMVRGVQGMNRAQIIAGGDIVTKFIESAANVTAGGNIDADTILHSRVSAKGTVKVSGKNGMIIGGDVRSIHGITARVIGNEMGTATIVGAGVDPALRKEIDQLKKSIVAENENRTKLAQIVAALQKLQQSGITLDPAKMEMLQKTTRNIIMIEQNIKQMRERLDEATTLLTDDEDARIKVERFAHSGTKILFGEISLYLKERAERCQFVKKGAEISKLTL